MADVLTTTTQVDPGVAVMYDRTLLMRAKPRLVHEKFAQRRPLSRKNGNTIKFRRYTNLSTATTPISEGVTPAGSRLAKTDLTAQINWYGDFVHITDVVDMTVEDAVLTEAAELLGQQAGETRDELVRDIMVATASITNASGGSNGSTPTEPTKGDIDGIVKTLLGNNAEMVAPMIRANTGVGTAPVRDAFWGIAHTDLIDDLEDVSNFRSVSEYPNPAAADEAEWGATGNVRWLVSSVADKTSGSPSTYKLPIIGKNAYGVTDLEGSMQNIVKAFGSAGTADPLNQRATSGWKLSMTARILNDNWIHVLNVTHS